MLHPRHSETVNSHHPTSFTTMIPSAQAPHTPTQRRVVTQPTSVALPQEKPSWTMERMARVAVQHHASPLLRGTAVQRSAVWRSAAQCSAVLRAHHSVQSACTSAENVPLRCSAHPSPKSEREGTFLGGKPAKRTTVYWHLRIRSSALTPRMSGSLDKTPSGWQQWRWLQM